MKVISAFLFCIWVGFQAKALCMEEYVGVHPREGSITRNPVFLLEFKAAEFKLANKLDELEFYLETDKKREIKVELLRKVVGVGPSTQLLLKPNSLLKLNDSVRLQVRLKKNDSGITDLQFSIFREKVNRRQWYVALATDNEPVTWQREITWNMPDFGANSLDAFKVRFNFQVNDSNPVYYEYTPGNTFQEQLFEVEVDNQIFYAVGGGFKMLFEIYRSACGGNFYLQYNKNYKARITALDFSGNRSLETQTLAFNTFRK